MFSSAEMQLLYKVGNAEIKNFPYPHILVHDVFPPDYYQAIRRNLPPREKMRTLKALGRVSSNYPDTRFVLRLTPDDVDRLDPAQRDFWDEFATWLLGGRLASLVIEKFAPVLHHRFGDFRSVPFMNEALVVQDYSTYALSPHTDSAAKVVSLLFYLPADESLAHLGTSIYIPRDPTFVCDGSQHHPFENFQRLATMPFVPNTLFAFVKTPNAFHGVEPIKEQIRRDLLLFDIRTQVAPSAQTSAPAAVPPSPAPAKFSF